MSAYRTFFLDDKNRVKETRLEDLKDPTGYRPTEAQFQALVPKRSNPKRYSPNAHPPVIGTQDVPETDIDGNPTGGTVQQNIYARWEDCLQREPFALLEAMTDEEKAERDADYEAEREAEEHAKQDAKPQALKNREKAFKDIGVSLGITFPLADGEMDTIIPALLAQIAQLRADNKDKEANELNDKATGLLAYWVGLGDDVLAPYIGEGGQ